MYHVRCSSCGKTRVFDAIENAQVAFNDHARRQHEVVLRRIDPLDAGAPLGPRDGGGALEAGEHDPETNDSTSAGG